MQTFTATTEKGQDNYLLFEAGDMCSVATRHESNVRKEFRDWNYMSFGDFMHKARAGDESLVAESDKILSDLEDQLPMSLGWRNVDDVVGAVPNVPAFLAGHPQCMRRRDRTQKDTSPIVVFMDLATSMGISRHDVQRRGVTMLALVRVLTNHRSVELWVGTASGMHGVSSTVAWRIDTMPLDLARAAFHIGSPSMSRGFGYGVARSYMGGRAWNGQWPFNDNFYHLRTAKDRLQTAFPGQDVVHVPPIHLSDPLTKDPVGWVKRVLNIGEEQ